MSVLEGGAYYRLGVPGVLPPVLDAGAMDGPDGGMRQSGLRIYELYEEYETKEILGNECEKLAQSVVKGITPADKKQGTYQAIYCCKEDEA